jgi:hypothetical protein
MSTGNVPEPFSVKPLSIGGDTTADWFRRFPNGGTVYIPERKYNYRVDWFRRAPTGGGTVLQSPDRAGQVNHLDGEDSH